MFFFSRKAQPEPVSTEAITPAITTETKFFMAADQMVSSEILRDLRLDTIDFVEGNRLTWGASRIVVNGVQVQVKLTENFDIAYTIDGETTFHPLIAAQMLDAARLEIAF